MKIAASLLLFSLASWSQVAADANKNYHTKEGREGVARTLDNPNRDQRQKPEEIIAALHLKPGVTVADIGTGTGYMLPHLSRAVGPQGKVFGEDIQNQFLDEARARVKTDGLTNAELFLGNENDPKLPAGSVDVAMVLDVYHHFDFPNKMLANIARCLKPDGHLVIVDYYKKNMPDHIRLERDEVMKEIESNGFKRVSKIDSIGANQYMLTFRRL
jgi:ubiquinone/menaquinone biosynthesis C-methylase UbiE